MNGQSESISQKQLTIKIRLKLKILEIWSPKIFLNRNYDRKQLKIKTFGKKHELIITIR